MRALKDALSFKDLPVSERIGFAVFIIFCLVFPWVTRGSFAQAVMIQFLIFCLYGLGWNLIGGYGGQVALGQAKNVGMSAYTVALLMVWWDVPFWFSTPLGVIIATVESFILGYFLLRLKGHYFAIATICVSLVWQQLFINWELIGGARGVELPLKEIEGNPELRLYAVYLSHLLSLFCLRTGDGSHLIHELVPQIKVRLSTAGD
jgi:branched-chain amino acid transport system permease protein